MVQRKCPCSVDATGYSSLHLGGSSMLDFAKGSFHKKTQHWPQVSCVSRGCPARGLTRGPAPTDEPEAHDD